MILYHKGQQINTGGGISSEELDTKQNALTAGRGILLEEDTISVKDPVTGITQAEYDVLSEEEKNTGLYIITDAEGSSNGSSGGMTEEEADQRYLKLTGGRITGDLELGESENTGGPCASLYVSSTPDESNIFSVSMLDDEPVIQVERTVYGETLVQIQGLAMTYNNRITNLEEPANYSDAANKGYVDNRLFNMDTMFGNYEPKSPLYLVRPINMTLGSGTSIVSKDFFTNIYSAIAGSETIWSVGGNANSVFYVTKEIASGTTLNVSFTLDPLGHIFNQVDVIKMNVSLYGINTDASTVGATVTNPVMTLPTNNAYNIATFSGQYQPETNIPVGFYKAFITVYFPYDGFVPYYGFNSGGEGSQQL